MRRYTMLICALTLSFVGVVFAQVSDDPNPPMSNESRQLWFVELKSPPTIEGTALNTLQSEKAQFRTAAQQAGLNFTERKAFNKLWNGLTVSIPKSQVTTLGAIQGVKSIYPVLQVTYEPMKPVDEPEMASAVKMTGADLAQNVLGMTGRGVKVGVIDTGIDYHHPDLGGCFGTGCRVVGGYDFVGDAYNADPTSASYNPVPVPDPNPMDCAGHGTHVAGIIGANGDPASNGVRGVAPGTSLYAYRVFGCQGSTDDSVMLEAMERALDDGVDVINMSIGSAYQWPEYPTAKASDRLVNKGIVVVASFGNNGANGLYSGGAPGVASKVIGVASIDNAQVALNYFTGVSGTKFGYVLTDSPLPPTSGSATLVRTGTTTTANDGCNPITTDLTGKFALIRRGTCSFYIKSANAMSAGAAGVMLYNNTAGFLNPTVAGTPPITIPVISITNTDGVILDAAIQAAGGSIPIEWTSNIGYFTNPTGGLISSFSSFGLSPDLILKPEISAPGGSIRSTYPLALGGYAVLSGTSMASPHVAGAAALFLQAKPNASPAKVRTFMMNTAQPAPWFGNPALGYLDNVHRQGAGLLNIYDALLSKVQVSPEKVSAGESAAGPYAGRLTVTNQNKFDVTYDVSWVDALATGPNTFTPAYYANAASVALSATSLSVRAGSVATLDFAVSSGTVLPDKSIYGGYIVFKPRDGGLTLRVPVAGFKGDYQSIQAMPPTAYGFPWLSSLVAGSYSKQGDNTAYTLQGGDVPYALVHFDQQVQVLKIEVFDAVKGKTWHFIDSEKYVGRNSSSTGFFAIAWDGTTMNGGGKTFTVPNGIYNIKISALKALGNPDNPADWETWTSPRLIISRP